MMLVTTTVATIAVTEAVTTSMKARAKTTMVKAVMIKAKKAIAKATAKVKQKAATMKRSGYMLTSTLSFFSSLLFTFKPVFVYFLELYLNVDCTYICPCDTYCSRR